MVTSIVAWNAAPQTNTLAANIYHTVDEKGFCRILKVDIIHLDPDEILTKLERKFFVANSSTSSMAFTIYLKGLDTTEMTLNSVSDFYPQ